MRQKWWVLKSHKALVDNETLSHSTLSQLSTDKLCRTGKLTHPIFKIEKKIKRQHSQAGPQWIPFGCFLLLNEKPSLCSLVQINRAVRLLKTIIYAPFVTYKEKIHGRMLAF